MIFRVNAWYTKCVSLGSSCDDQVVIGYTELLATEDVFTNTLQQQHKAYSTLRDSISVSVCDTNVKTKLIDGANCVREMYVPA
jgi:hypothetical protein